MQISREKRRIVNRPKESIFHTSGKKEIPIPDNKDIKMEKYSSETESYFNNLIRIHDKNLDNGSPFYATLPPINDMINLNVLSEVKKHEVLSLYSEKNIDRIDEEYDIVTIIPFRNRYLHLEKILDSLDLSRKTVSKKIGFIIIENSSNPIVSDLCKKYERCQYRWLNSKGKIFNKCICHNIGVYTTKSNIVHFHDCDLLVPLDFYSCLISEMEKKDAVQCFPERRVNYLHKEPSGRIFDGENFNNFINESNNYRTGNRGAPGGSIALNRDLFNKVGGYDPHLFWGYSIEDAFFWKKIEIYTNVSSMKTELYHLWHPSAVGKNPHERFEKKYYDAFCIVPDKNSYINKSIEIYNDILKKIVI